MHRRTFVAAAAVGLAGCASSSAGVREDTTVGPDPAAAAAAVRQRLNEARESAGVAALRSDDGLADAARAHSQDMHRRDFYAHENPDGEDPSDRAGCRAAENLHHGDIAGGGEFDTSSADGLAAYVVDGWRDSEGHREIMLASGYRAVGIGVAIADGEFFAVAMFC
jgi:uncharacterized protein YkwD